MTTLALLAAGAALKPKPIVVAFEMAQPAGA